MQKWIYLMLMTFQISVYAQSRLEQDVEALKRQNQALAEQMRELHQSHSDTQIGGYGQLNYNHYRKDTSRNQMDLSRFVLSVGHRFDDRLSFVGEMEWEHAVTSASDKGEAAIEQAYIHWKFSDQLAMKAGLFLMPFGFLNQSHEPPVFYGVERNEVETRIIPSTWREGGVGIFGNCETGFAWSLGVVTGFDMAKLDDAKAPLAGSHQELQFAKAKDLALFGSLDYQIPGFVSGLSVFTGKSTQGDADFSNDNKKPSFAGINGRVTLSDLHVRWQKSGWDVQGLYAHGSIADSEKFNNAIAAYNTANPSSTRTFVPKEFYGWLVQAAYKFSLTDKLTLAPFARFEKFDSQAKMSSGLDSDSANRDRVTTIGFSLHPDRQVVFKIDYQRYAINADDSRANLGLGYMF